MASPDATRRFATEARLLGAALRRRRGTVTLAVLAVAIGASVASALLHVSADIGRKVTHELRALGPNLLVVPAAMTDADEGRFLDEAPLRSRLAGAGVQGVPMLYAWSVIDRGTVPIVGTDLAAARQLHPGWRISGAVGTATDVPLMGARLMSRLGVSPGSALTLNPPGVGGESVTVTVGARLEAGGADDEAFWIPLELAQRVSGLSGRVSLAQARLEGDAAAAAVQARAIEAGGGVRTLVLHALSATEGRLLERMRRLMALVTIAALVAAGLCAFGTLTDLALERRKEIALMKALGATRGGVIRLFAAESLTIGALGGVLGWLIGYGFAQVIGREVFHSGVALRWDVPLMVVALAMGVAGIAGLGPIRLALAVEPAPALRGD